MMDYVLKMMSYVEKRLLPKLKVSVPQMAEKLRFLHMEVRELQYKCRLSSGFSLENAD